LAAKFKKTGNVTLTTTISLSSRLALDIFYMPTKFGDSRFSRSGDMNTGDKTENGLPYPDHAPFKDNCHPMLDMI